MKCRHRCVGTVLAGVLLSAWGLAGSDVGICFILLIQWIKPMTSVVLEAMRTKGCVIPVQGALKACVGGLRIPACLAGFTSLALSTPESKILEIPRTVGWVSAKDGPC